MAKTQTTNPTPLIATSSTAHMRTTHVLFNRDLAFWTFMSSYIKSPSLIYAFLSLITTFLIMPWYLTFETRSFLACITTDFWPKDTLGFYYKSFAARIGAKLLIFRFWYFIVLHKLLELIEWIWTTKVLNLFSWYHSFTFKVWTFDLEYLARFVNHEPQMIIQALFAKVMSTFKKADVLQGNFILITNFTWESLCFIFHELLIDL